MFYRLGDDICLSGIPAPTTRKWLANLAAHAQFTFHLKPDVVADLPATATVIIDPAGRRRVLAVFVEEFSRGMSAVLVTGGSATSARRWSPHGCGRDVRCER